MGGGGSAGNTATLQVQPGSAPVTLSAGRTFSFTTDRNIDFRIGSSSLLTIAGVLGAQGTNTAARNLTKSDAGTLVLTNKNLFAGAATNSPGILVRGGTLQLDSSAGTFTASSDRFFPDATNPLPLAFSATTGTFAGGGTLEIVQAAGNAFDLTQGFGNVTFNTGANLIKLTNLSATQGLTLNLGSTFTRTALLGATVNFVTSSAGGVNTIGSTIANANGIVSGYSTFNGLDWVTQTSGNLVAFSGYNASYPASGATAASNYSLAGGQTVTASQTINSMKFAPASGTQTITLNSGVTQTVTSGGLLFDNTNGSASITGAGQWGASGAEVMVHTWGGGDVSINKLTLNGVIKGSNTAISKSGSGTLVLSGTNTYTGALIINAGAVEFSNGGATGQNLGSPTAGAGNILLNGGTLRPTATGNLIFGITVNGFAALNTPTSVTLSQTAQGITGKAGVTGILQKTGAGTLTFSGSADNPTLSLEVVGGVVNLGKNSSATVHSVGVAAGSTAAANMGAALLIGNGGTANITGTGGDQIHDQSSVVVRAGGVLNLGGGTATAESFDSLAGGGSVTNTSLDGTFNLTLGAGNNVNVSAYSLSAADAGVAATGLNHFSGVISDGSLTRLVALTKIGSGIQILSGSNTYSGATTINAGTLQLGSANALPSGAGKGNVVVNGNGYGQSTINGGTVIGSANRVLAIGTLDMGGNDQAINGLDSTSGGLVVNNPSLSWSGSEWVASASTNVLTLGNGDADGAFDGTLRNGYTVAPGVSGATGYVGTLALGKVGSGTQILSGPNAYTGPTRIEAGTLHFAKKQSLYGGNTAAWTAANLVVDSGAMISFSVGGAEEFSSGDVNTLVGNVTSVNLNGLKAGSKLGFNTSNAGGSFAIATAIPDSTGPGGGSVGLVKNGTGALVLSGGNTFSGATEINAGTLRLGAGGTTGALNPAATIAVASGARFIVDRSNTTAQGIDYSSAAITGAGSFEQAGSGTTILTAANTYSGGTTVSGGILLVNNTTGSGTGSGAVAVESGSTLGGTGTIDGATSLAAGSYLAPGDPAVNGGIGTIKFNGTLTNATGATWLIDLVADVNGSADRINLGTGSLNLNDAALSLVTSGVYTAGYTYTIATYASLAGTFNGLSDGAIISGYQINYGTTAITLTAVPEPGTLGLLGLALGGFFVRRLRKRRNTTTGKE